MTLLSTNHNEAAAECMAMIGRHIPSAEEKIRASESFQKDVLVAAHMEALHDAYILEMGSHEHSMHKLKVEVSSPTSVHAISSLKPSTLKQLKVGKVHRRRVVRGTLCVNTLCTKVGPSGAGHTPIAVNVLEDEDGNATPIYIVCNSMMKKDVCSLDSAQAQLMFPIGSKVAIREPYVTRLPHGEVVLSVENSTDVVFLWVPDQSRSDDDLNMGSKPDEEELNDHGALNVINNVILDVADDEETSKDFGSLESVIDNIGICDTKNVDTEDHEEKTLEVEELVHDSLRVVIDNIGICDTKNVDIEDHEETLKDKYLGHGSLDVSDDRRKCDMKDVDVEVPEGKSKVEHGPLDVVKNVGCGILKEVGVDEQETQEISIQEKLGHIDEANVVNNAPKYEANACPEVDDTIYGSKCKEDENNVTVDNNVNKVEEIEELTSNKCGSDHVGSADGLKESEDVMMPSVGIEEKDENENENDRIGSGNRSVELHSVEMVDVIGNGESGDSRVYDPTVVNGVQNRDEDVMHYTTASEEEERILVQKEEETSDADASILRTKGNELFTRGEYIKAGEMYTRALKAAAVVTAHILLSSGSDVLDTDNERLKMEEVLCFSNRAEVWLRLGDDEKAFADADAAMAAIHLLQKFNRSGQQHKSNVAMAKALFRKGRALMGLRRYHEALVLFYHLQHLSKDPHLFNAITTCKSRLAHQGMKSRRAKPSQ